MNKIRLLNKICLACQKKFKTWRNNKFCSPKCYWVMSSRMENKGRFQKGKRYSRATEFKKGHQSGEKHKDWKGDKVGYTALHDWVRKHLGRPKKCVNCETTSNNSHAIQWANKSQEYRRDLSDWLRLCASCHKRYDLGLLSVCP